MTFAVAGDPITRTLAASLGGRAVEVDDAQRAAYHAAAVVAANHLVALLGQVERLAEQAGLPLEAFAGLVRAAADDAFALGPSRALTGPAARGDWHTLERHRTVIAEMPDRRPSSRPTTRWSVSPAGSPGHRRWRRVRRHSVAPAGRDDADADRPGRIRTGGLSMAGATATLPWPVPGRCPATGRPGLRTPAPRPRTVAGYSEPLDDTRAVARRSGSCPPWVRSTPDTAR